MQPLLKPTWRWWTGPDRVIQLVLFWAIVPLFVFASIFLAVLLSETSAQRWVAVPLAAVAAGIFTVGFSAWMSWVSSSQGGRKFASKLEQASRQRRLPADADASWVPIMARFDRMWTRERYLTPILMGLFAVGCGVARVGEMLNDDSWQAWAGLVIFPLAMIFLPIDAHRKLTGIRLIRAELDEKLRQTS